MDARQAPQDAEAHRGGRVDLSRWPLVGRDDELTLATVALESYGCVVLTGAAGVGKTRLAHEVLARATRDGDETEWVAATHTAASIPLGAVAHLVPDSAIGRGRDATLRAIVGALRRVDGHRLLLGIDDAHLLDDASAALAQLLVAGGTARAVITVRSEEPAPDSIASLWKDGPAPLVALQTPARAEVGPLSQSFSKLPSMVRRCSSCGSRAAATRCSCENWSVTALNRARCSACRACGGGAVGSKWTSDCTRWSRCVWAH